METILLKHFPLTKAFFYEVLDYLSVRLLDSDLPEMLHPHIHIDSRKVPIYGEIKKGIFCLFVCIDQVYRLHSLF